mgnify:FL=1
MKKILSIVLLLAILAPTSIFAGLVYTGEDTDNVSVAPSTSINNLQAGTILLWVNLTTVTPSVNTNFWGKSSGGNRNVGYIRIATGNIAAEVGGTTVCQSIATFASLPNF